jgi:hypothetical protein
MIYHMINIKMDLNTEYVKCEMHLSDSVYGNESPLMSPVIKIRAPYAQWDAWAMGELSSSQEGLLVGGGVFL